MLQEWLDYRNFTTKHYVTYGIILGILFILLFYFTFIYQSKEERETATFKRDMKIVLDYNEDLLKPVKEEDKTLDELVADIVKEQLGVGATPVTYKTSTIREGLGLFVESSIVEAETIPSVAALSREERNKLTDENDDMYVQEMYDQIVERKEKTLKSYRANEISETDALMMELKKALQEQEQKKDK